MHDSELINDDLINDDLINEVAAGFGLTLDTMRSLDGSFSGSRVLPARAAEGFEVVLKITIRNDPAWAGSVTEAAFYRQLAQRIGVATPALLDHRVDEEVVALVITRHPAPTPAAEWKLDDWLLLAGDLATIHQLDYSGDDRAHRVVPQADRTVLDFWSGTGIAELLSNPGPVERLATVLDPCFVHGDCHVDNISRDHRRLIWLDWQGCGIGDPVGDLAFPAVRAAPSGVQPPLPEMIEVYADRRGLDRDLLRLAVLARELLVLAFEWPHYAGFDSAAGNARVRSRVFSLISGLPR